MDALFTLTNSAPYMTWWAPQTEESIIGNYNGQPFNTAYSAAGRNLVMSSLASFGRAVNGDAKSVAVDPTHLAIYVSCHVPPLRIETAS